MMAGFSALPTGDDLSRFFGLKPQRQRRRADRIAEHDGQLSALGSACRGASGVEERVDRGAD
jgi:hypothetical protein